MGERSFFVDPGTIREGTAEIRGPIAHQMARVLRLRPGDDLELLDNSGAIFVARISDISREVVSAQVVEQRWPGTEPPVRLDLYQALLKGQKMEWVLQKGTEIGVTRFVPVLSERCVSRPTAAEMTSRLERWRAIVREAAEQSGRTRLPEVALLESFDQAVASAAAAGLAVMAWEQEDQASLAQLLREAGQSESGDVPCVSVLVGPEGGFSRSEAALARVAGLRTVALGPRILRAETAAIVAATAVLWETGGLGGQRH